MLTPEELEDAAAAAAVAGLRERLEALVLRALTLYESLLPEVRSAILETVAASLEALDTTDVTVPILAAAREALEMGAADTARRARVPVGTLRTSTAVTRAAEQAPAKATEELVKAAAKVRVVEDVDDLQDALIDARRAVTRTEAAARFAVNRSLSDGTQQVADRHGLSRVWLPERDACVHCLAYAGEVAGPGERFRGGLTFGKKPLVPAGAHVDCPLHPNCRCRVQVYNPARDSPDFPDSLKREALRSILRGWSMESESPRVRLDAAERALKSAGRMPKSVQEYARKAIKKGKFPRGRGFPAIGN